MFRILKTFCRLLPLAVLVICLPAKATMDRIELSNGSIIIGSFVDADNGKVVVETEFAGTLKIDQSRIVSIDVQQPVTLQMDDGTVLSSDSFTVSGKTLTLDEQVDVDYALQQLLRINPEPWELGRGYRHTGVASSALSIQRGNTVLDELNYKVDTRWTGLHDRYTLKLQGEVREANRERNAENWMITGKYDRLQRGEYYWGVITSAEENRFADLDLRTTIGPYVGRSLLKNTPFVLEIETGVSQVSEDFREAENRDYVGFTWSVRSETDYLGNESRLYVDHKGIKNLAERDNLILNTTMGLALPLFGRIQGATELVLDYNSGAVAGTDKLDQTYRFRIGYSW